MFQTSTYIGLRAAYDEALAGRLDLDMTLMEASEQAYDAFTADPCEVVDLMEQEFDWNELHY